MRIIIVGLGVIGGSFAMGLREAGYDDIYAVDIDMNALKVAETKGIIKKGYTDGKSILPTGDLVVFAIYPQLLKRFIEENRNYFKCGALLTDTTGVKKPIIEEVLRNLPSSVDFVFGHPMAGREKRGLDYASPKVFKGANYIITPVESNIPENVQKVEKLVREIGFGNVTKVTPDFHDQIIAFTSQLPHVISVCLINSDIEGRKTGKYIGDSYRELTRIANINEDLWTELFLENKENLLESINNFERQLNKIKTAINADDTATLKSLFKKSSNRREKL